MNKRIILSILLIGILMFGAGMGTIAYYSQSFESQSNTVRGAIWNVTANGLLNEDFTFTYVPVAPGDTSEDYTFEINKNDTEVNIDYEVTVTGEGDLFAAGTPITFNLGFNGADKVVMPLGQPVTFTPPSDFQQRIDKFSLNCQWPWGDGTLTDGKAADNAWAGKTGKVKLTVVAKQVASSTGDPGEINADSTIKAKVRLLGINGEIGDEEEITIRLATGDTNRTLTMSGSKYLNGTFTVAGTQASTNYTAKAQLTRGQLGHLIADAVNIKDWNIDWVNNETFKISGKKGNAAAGIELEVVCSHAYGAGNFWFGK